MFDSSVNGTGPGVSDGAVADDGESRGDVILLTWKYRSAVAIMCLN